LLGKPQVACVKNLQLGFDAQLGDALGTGDIDCVYHIALPELIESVDKDEFPDAYEMLQTIVGGRRLRDLTDLPLDLAV
jgi:hypothetical protein